MSGRNFKNLQFITQWEKFTHGTHRTLRWTRGKQGKVFETTIFLRTCLDLGKLCVTLDYPHNVDDHSSDVTPWFVEIAQDSDYFQSKKDARAHQHRHGSWIYFQ